MIIIGVFLINQIRTGGDRDYIELLELLAERGNKVFVLLNTYLEYKPKFITPIYLSVKYVRHRLPPASFLFLKEIKKNICLIKDAFKDSIPQIVHIHGDIYLKSAIFLKKYLKIPMFYASRANDITRTEILRKYKAYTVKEYLFSLLYEHINRYRERQIAEYSELICFLNPADKDLFVLRTKRDTKNVIIIPNHIGFPHFTEETRNINKSNNLSSIVYVGSVSPEKGIWDLLKAASILKKNGYNLKYHILGRKDNIKKTLKLIKKLGLEENIVIEGYTSPFPFFEKCDLFVYPTLYDAWGNVITEALHCGCPVFASNSSGPSYILQHNELLFNIGSSEEIAEKIKNCIIDNDYYHKIRYLCAERSGQLYFNWAEMFEKAMIEYLNENEISK